LVKEKDLSLICRTAYAHVVVKLAAPYEAFDFSYHFVEQSLHWPISAFRHRRCKARLPKLNRPNQFAIVTRS
jgi:hypothetical protein